MLNNENNPFIDISNFMSKFVIKHNNFNGYIQNDSQEFLRILLEDISNELNINRNNGSLQYQQINYSNT